jgi:hypothetical protein
VRATWARDRKEGTADHRSGDRRFDSSSSGWGLHLLSWVGAAPPPTEVAQPDPLCRGGCGFRATTRLLLSASFTHPPHQLASSTPPSGLGTPCLGPSPLATWRSGDLLLSPSAPPMRCPGAVSPPRRLARGSVRPRPASSPEERILRRCSGSLAMPRSEDRLAARLPSFRKRGLGGPPSIPTKTWRSRNLVYREGRENGESGGGGGRRGVGGPRPTCCCWTSRSPVSTRSFRPRSARR